MAAKVPPCATKRGVKRRVFIPVYIPPIFRIYPEAVLPIMRTHERRVKRDNEGRNKRRDFVAPPPCPFCHVCPPHSPKRLREGSLRSPYSPRRGSECAPLARPLCVGYRRRYAVHRTGLDTPTGAPAISYWRHSTETSGARHNAFRVASKVGTSRTMDS